VPRTAVAGRWITVALVAVSMQGCGSEPLEREPWIDRPIDEWPHIAMTNQVTFKGQSYDRLGNSFLVVSRSDTFAVTVKHTFLAFRQIGLETIDLGEDFVSWRVYPKGHPDRDMLLGELVNADPKEKTGEFRTLKVRDWILFRLKESCPDIRPLRIRERPVEPDEIVTAVGWARAQETANPTLIRMKVYRNPGPYFYVQTLTQGQDPAGRSGSPVIDENGHLVGIVSGAEGRLGVVGSVEYLNTVLNRLDRAQE
jgi:hypothetical protein